MLLNELSALADLLGIEWQSGKENITVVCPFSKWTHGKGRTQHPPGSMSWHVKKGVSEYNCHACGKAGTSLAVMILQLDDLGYFKGIPEMRRKALELVITGEGRAPSRVTDSYSRVAQPPELVRLVLPPPSYVKVYADSALVQYPPLLTPVAGGTPEMNNRLYKDKGTAALNYLRNERGLADSTILEWDMRIDQTHDRVITPVRWHTGHLIGMVGRLFRKPDGDERLHHTYWRCPKGMVLFGEHLITPRPLVIVEGPFDVFRIVQAGLNAVATLGTKFTTFQADKIAEWGQPAIIFYDYDKAGLEKAPQLFEYLHKKIPVKVVYPDQGRDAGDYSEEEIRELLVPEIDRMTAGRVIRRVSSPLQNYWGMKNDKPDA